METTRIIIAIFSALLFVINSIKAQDIPNEEYIVFQHIIANIRNEMDLHVWRECHGEFETDRKDTVETRSFQLMNDSVIRQSSNHSRLGKPISSCDTCRYVIYVLDSLLGSNNISNRTDTIGGQVVQWIYGGGDKGTIATPLDTLTLLNNIVFVKATWDQMYHQELKFCKYGKYYIGTLLFTRIFFDDTGEYAVVSFLFGTAVYRMVLHRTENQWEIISNNITSVF